MLRTFIFYIFCCITTSIWADSRTVYNISNYNYDFLKKPNSYFIIREIVDLKGEEFAIGANSVIDFQGGHFYRGRIDINGAYIEAPAYCIFDGTELFGIFANDNVQAEWFHSKYAGDTGTQLPINEVVNHALQNVNDNCVILSGNEYTVNNPIHLNKPGQRFFYNGRLTADKNITSDSSIIEVSSPNTKLYVRGLYNNPAGTGIHIGGNVINSQIEIHTIYNIQNGLNFSPIGPSSGQTISNNKFIFSKIYATNAILFNPAKDSIPLIRIDRNYLQGGRLYGKYGFLGTNPLPTKPYPSHANVFYSIGFENLEEGALIMRGSDNDFFVYARMLESLPKSGPFISVADSRHSHIYTKGYTTAGKEITNGDNVYNIDIHTLSNIADDFYNKYLTSALVNSPSKDALGQSIKALSSTIAPMNMIRTINYHNAASLTFDSIYLKDLFVPIVEDGTCFFNNIAKISIGNKHIVTLKKYNTDEHINDINDITNITNIPMILVIDINGYNSMFTVEGKEFSVSSSGTFRITWTNRWDFKVEKIS